MDVLKTYYVLRDKGEFKEGQTIIMEREKARPYVGSGVLMLFHVAFRNNLVKSDVLKKQGKKKRKKTEKEV